MQGQNNQTLLFDNCFLFLLVKTIATVITITNPITSNTDTTIAITCPMFFAGGIVTEKCRNIKYDLHYNTTNVKNMYLHYNYGYYHAFFY